MAKAPQVRLACAKDVNDLVDLVSEAHAEEALGPVSSLSEDCVFRTILRALSGEAVIGVIDGEDEIASACYLSACMPWYSQSALLDCLFLYSRAAYRKSHNSKKLLTWAKEQSERLNSTLQIEIPASESVKPKLALAQRVLGSDRKGAIFVYTPNPNKPAEAPEIEVRPAEAGDEPEVIATIRQLAVEDGSYPPSDEIAIPFIRGALNGDGLIGIIKPKNEVEALVFLKIARPWYSQDLYLDEYLLYCKKQHRKSKNARSLVQFAKRAADRLALPLRIGITSKNDNVRKQALYARMLCDPTNFFLIHKPKAA